MYNLCIFCIYRVHPGYQAVEHLSHFHFLKIALKEMLWRRIRGNVFQFQRRRYLTNSLLQLAVHCGQYKYKYKCKCKYKYKCKYKCKYKYKYKDFLTAMHKKTIQEAQRCFVMLLYYNSIHPSQCYILDSLGGSCGGKIEIIDDCTAL